MSLFLVEKIAQTLHERGYPITQDYPVPIGPLTRTVDLYFDWEYGLPTYIKVQHPPYIDWPLVGYLVVLRKAIPDAILWLVTETTPEIDLEAEIMAGKWQIRITDHYELLQYYPPQQAESEQAPSSTPPSR